MWKYLGSIACTAAAFFGGLFLAVVFVMLSSDGSLTPEEIAQQATDTAIFGFVFYLLAENIRKED